MKNKNLFIVLLLLSIVLVKQVFKYIIDHTVYLIIYPILYGAIFYICIMTIINSIFKKQKLLMIESIIMLLLLSCNTNKIEAIIKYNLLKEKYNEEVKDVLNQTSDEQIIELKNNKYLSISGEISIFGEEQDKIIGFWIDRWLMIDDSPLLIYTTVRENNINEIINYKYLKKVDDNWYYVVK